MNEKSKDDELLLRISHLETIIDNLPFDVWLKDAGGNYLVVNKSMSKSLCLPKQKLLGKGDHGLYPDALADKFILNEHAAIAEKAERYYEAEFKNIIYEEYAKPIFDKSGQPSGVVGCSRDITESKKINDALVESERGKAVLLSNLPGVAYRCNNDECWTMTFLSEGCRDLTGYTAEELLAKKPSFFDLIPPDELRALNEKWRMELKTDLASTDEYRIVTASGDIKWVWEQSQRIYDSDHNIIAHEGFIADITEQKLAEKALMQSEERFRTIFEEAPFGIGIFDSLDGQAYQVNTRFAEIIGRTKEEALALTWQQYSHPDEIEENLYRMSLLNAGKITRFSMNKRYIKPDGSTVWVNMEVAPFQSEVYFKPCHLCMIEDITARKEAEEEILYLSFYDQLTGLYNRRFYEENLRRLDTERNLPLTLIVADVNGLKLVNDAFGHMTGDRLLKKIAEIMKKECRDDDIIARIGGDEFVLLLPGTDFCSAKKLIQRLNKAIARESEEDLIFSVSFGWGTKKEASEDIAKVYISAEDGMYRQKLSESRDMRSKTIKIITQALYKKDPRAQLHCERVSRLCEIIGKELKMSPDSVKELKMAGLLHDIGKIGINENMLLKESGLTELEWTDIKRHPEIGYHILRSVNEFAPIAEYVLNHHERLDGKGYPSHLEGAEIPIQSKIISVADAFDAMTSHRPYRSELCLDEVKAELRENAGSQFDKDIVEVFIEKILSRPENIKINLINPPAGE